MGRSIAFKAIFRVDLFLVGVLALTGCGLTSSPADNLTFAAPEGWQGTPGIMGMMQFWKSPASGREILMLFKSPNGSNVKTGEAFHNANLRDEKMISQRVVTICGNQKAQYLKAVGAIRTGTSTANEPDNEYAELMMTVIKGQAYVAVYLYPIKSPPNPQAEAALSQLCLKS